MAPTSIDGNEIAGATIDGQNVSEITVDGDVVFTAGPDIPDSAIHQWPMDEGGGDSVADNIGSADGTINGGITWTSGSWEGGYALDSDGSSGSYIETTTLGDFGSSLDLEWSLLVTVETTLTDRMALVGVVESTEYWQLEVNDDQDQFGLNMRDADGNREDRYSTGVDVPDGDKHRLVVTSSNGTTSGMELYFDGSVVSSTSRVSQGGSNYQDFTNPVAFFRRGNDDQRVDGILDNIILTDSELSASEIQEDYNNQPWS